MNTKEAKISLFRWNKALFDFNGSLHGQSSAACDTARTGYDCRLRNAFY